jgi:hypothetical protein
MGKTRKKKLAQREAQRQETRLSTADYVRPRPPMQTPISAAHTQLDQWIRGEIGGDQDGAYRDHIDAAHFGVINLGILQRTMVLAREFYKQHADIIKGAEALKKASAKTPLEPRTGATIADFPTMENKRGEWVPAIPLPLYGLKKGCSCGASFWFERNYEAHYALTHIVLAEHKL